MARTTPNHDAPEWFLRAIETPFASRRIPVAGCPIHYQYWGDRNRARPGIVLVHGHGAHAHWWDFLAPGLMQHANVAAIDLSGNGDSGPRDEYSLATYAEEIHAVADDAGFGNDTILVGHSFGGTAARMAALSRPERLRALVLLDSALTPRRGSSAAARAAPVVRPGRPSRERVYPSREVAARRFRLRPPQDCANEYILRHLAFHSVEEVPGGWRWKGDRRIFSRMTAHGTRPLPDLATMLHEWHFPVGIIYGEKSRFFPAPLVAELENLVPPRQLHRVADAHHHLFLDRPCEVLSALQAMLAMEEAV